MLVKLVLRFQADIKCFVPDHYSETEVDIDFKKDLFVGIITFAQGLKKIELQLALWTGLKFCLPWALLI